MHKNAIYRRETNWKAIIPLLDSSDFGIKVMIKTAIGFLLESSPRKSKGYRALRPREYKGMKGCAVP
jgi:hypothetical protein